MASGSLFRRRSHRDAASYLFIKWQGDAGAISCQTSKLVMLVHKLTLCRTDAHS